MIQENWTDMLWILMASFLVFIMQAGFAMVESGMTRSKNSINVAIKNLTDLGVSFLAFWMFGFALMFGLSRSGIVGSSGFFLDLGNAARPVWAGVFFLFQSMFCSTAATIVSGAVAERMKYSAYIISTIVLAALVYPVFGHWSWGSLWLGGEGGWLEALGFVDFAGSTVVHSIGGWISLAALIIIGPRRGRFTADGQPVDIPASNIPMVVLGVILLWFGWFGFNGGSTLELNGLVPGILLNTALSASAGMVASLIAGWPLSRKPDVNFVLNGSLAGLVAITANAHAVSALEAVIIGAVGGWVMLASTRLLLRLRIDDAVGAIPVHLAAGIWGTLAVGIFGDPEILGTGLTAGAQTAVQALGIGSAALWSMGISLPLLWIINRVLPLRVDALAEENGLNVSEHGVSTETHGFFQVLEAQARSGDLSLRAPVEPFTEVGQIALRYNSVLDTLQESTIAGDEFSRILTHIHEGLLVVRSDLSVGGYYSLASEKILNTRNLGGRNLLDILRPVIGDDRCLQLREYLGLMFDTAVEPGNLAGVNPLKKVECHLDSRKGSLSSRFLQFNFVRIYEPGEAAGESQADSRSPDITRVMILIRDISQEEELGRQIEKNRNEHETNMELFYKLLQVDPRVLQDFLSGSATHLAQLHELLKGELALAERLEKIFHILHRIKGDANMIQMGMISRECHRIEERIGALPSGDQLRASDFLGITVAIARLEQLFKRIQGLMEKLMHFHREAGEAGLLPADGPGTVPDGRQNSGLLLAASLVDYTETLSRAMGKSVHLDTEDFDESLIPAHHRTSIKDILVQLLQNSLAHGIEGPVERRNLGKPERARIRLRTREEHGNLQLEFFDDGRGIDREKVRRVLVSMGILGERDASALGNRDLLRYIFHPGLSTYEQEPREADGDMPAAPIAGRGMGLKGIQDLVQHMKGKIELASRAGTSFRISISIPAGLPVLSGAGGGKLLHRGE